jgi:hypothetical protein
MTTFERKAIQTIEARIELVSEYLEGGNPFPGACLGDAWGDRAKELSLTEAYLEGLKHSRDLLYRIAAERWRERQDSRAS